jgi:hypothetical protein
MAYQQAQLRWVYDNPVPDNDRTLYLVNAVVGNFLKRESTKNGKWFTKMRIADVTGEYEAKIYDGNAGEMPQSYLGKTVAFNIKAERYKGKNYISGFWELEKAAIPVKPPCATPSPAMKQSLPVFDENGQVMTIQEADKALAAQDVTLQDRIDRGVALMAIATYNAELPDYAIENLLKDADTAFNWIKTGNVPVSEPDEPGSDG